MVTVFEKECIMSDLSIMRTVSDHGILRCDSRNRIFGTAASGQSVKMRLSRRDEVIFEGSTQAETNGRWEMFLPPVSASFEPCELCVSAGEEQLTVTDLLFGELFHISGQSNMELPVYRTIDPFDPHTPKENRYIREFRVPVMPTFGENEEYEDFQGGTWECAVGEPLMQMSGTGVYFAQTLFESCDVPIGLINTAAGGAPVESRLPCSILRSFGKYDSFLDECTRPGYMEDTTEKDREKYRLWCEDMESRDEVSASIFDLDDLQGKCEIPFYFREDERFAGFSGRVWFRKTFVIPDDVGLDENALLSLGVMIDADIVYVNGAKVGETGYMYPPRLYDIPAGGLHHGENTVLVRLEVRTGNGGFVKGKRYCLKAGDRIIDLSGEWEYAIAAEAPYLEPDVFFQGLPLSMYAAMTAPAFNLNCTGLIWYQAESNGNWEDYPALFAAFVEMYRRRCGYDIPVVFAQLPNFDDPSGGIPPESWCHIREAQRSCLDIPGTAMTVNIDIGESNDLHPKNKWDVGRRLAYAARRLIFGDDVKESAPVRAAVTGAGELLLTLTNSESLTARRSPMEGFTVTDEKGISHPACGVLCEKGVTVSFDKEISPVSLRYLWENDPDMAELYCGELPVTPFELPVDPV